MFHCLDHVPRPYSCVCAQSCPTLCDPINCSPQGSYVHGISQVRILEWVALSSFMGSSRPRDQTHVSYIAGKFFTHEPPGKLSIRVFSNESALCIRWPKYWNFSFSISLSNEYSGLFSFKIDWFDLLAVQGTPHSLLQHQSSKASILWCSAFFKVQLSHPYMTTGKTIALTTWTFVGKEMSLLFNMLSRLVITFLPRSKHLLI